MSTFRSLVAAVLLLHAACAPAQHDPRPTPGGQSADDVKREATEEALAQFQDEAAAYRILIEGDTKPLALHDESVLHWGNPARTRENGAFYVWLRDGRPEVAGSIFTYQTNEAVKMKHEMVSLSARPLRAEYRDQLAWAPTRGGVAMKPFEDAPPSAGSPRLRLTQMRNLTRRFAATLTEQDGDATELRLMSQPLHRYESESAGIVDGGLFALVAGTDPEVLVLIEARASGGAARWHYGLARCHHVALNVRLDGEDVWSVEPRMQLTTAYLGEEKFVSEPYISYWPKTR